MSCPPRLEALLAATLSPDNSIRRAAEEELKLATRQRGFACAVAFRLARSNQVSDGVSAASEGATRLMSGVVLQHYVKDVWKGADDALLPQADKEQVQRLMLGTMADGGAPRKIRTSAALVIALIAASGEWPSAWPDLVPLLVGQLAEA
ncbi:unnamed protein product, partial [Discosporangium mesarthrocarpum]